MATDDTSRQQSPKTKCVVIGGRSFIGTSLVTQLLKSDNWIIRIADSDPSPNLDLVDNAGDILLSDAISSGIASYVQVDLRVKSQLIEATEGSSVVFHIGAPVSAQDDFYLQYMATVQATKNVIRACQESRVKRLIHNSSADVVFDGTHDILNGNDSLPYPRRFEDMLSDLRAQAEAAVLFANGSDELSTCVLRPSNAFGPGDVKFVPLLLSAAKSGLAKFIVGNGENMYDFTYIDNVAHAHICAEEALRSKTSFVSGKAYFITNLEPMKFWDFVSLILEGLGYPRPRFKIPATVVLFMAELFSRVHEKLKTRNASFLLTPSTVHQFSHTMTFNCSEAQNQIGYSPIVSLEEGITLTVESFENSIYLRHQCASESSKVDGLLGGGRVADLLLWKDEKKTFTCFLSTTLLYYWFILSGRAFVSSTSKLLLMISVVLFIHGFLPSSLFGFTLYKLSPSQFEVSESVTDTVKSVASAWNHCMQDLRLIGQGGNSNVFLKVMLILYLFKLFFSLPFSAVTGIALVFAFTAFFVYMQYEDEVDRLMEFSSIGIQSLKELLIRNLPVSVASILIDYQIIGEDEFPMVKD